MKTYLLLLICVAALAIGCNKNNTGDTTAAAQKPAADGQAAEASPDSEGTPPTPIRESIGDIEVPLRDDGVLGEEADNDSPLESEGDEETF